jgi:hypothetical protein
MLSFIKYNSPIQSSEFISMNSLAFPVSGAFDSDAGIEWRMMSLITMHDLFSHISDQSQFTFQQENAFIADFQSIHEKSISLSGLKVRDADALSFFEKANSVWSNDIYFSIEVPFEQASADCWLIIDSERAESFIVTVFGMFSSEDNGLRITNQMSRCFLRQRSESIGTGRMICLLKQQFNL